MSEELKACHRGCDREGIVTGYLSGIGHYVRCQACGAGVIDGLLVDARAAWNRRETPEIVLPLLTLDEARQAMTCASIPEVVLNVRRLLASRMGARLEEEPKP